MRIHIHHSRIEEFISEINKQNTLFETFADGGEQCIHLEYEFIKTTRHKEYYQINEYKLTLVEPETNKFKFVALLDDGFVTVNPEFKAKFKDFGSDLLQEKFTCNRCGKSMYRKVFVCLNPQGEYMYYGGKCIDTVYPQYKYMSQFYKRFDEFCKSFDFSEEDFGGLGYTNYKYHWFHDIEVLLRYLYDKFKNDPMYSIKNDGNLDIDNYFETNELPKYTDEIKSCLSDMISYYLTAEIPTDNDFLFNMYTMAKRNFEYRNYIISNGLSKWIVAVYLQKRFPPVTKAIINPYNVGDKVRNLPVTIIEKSLYEETWGYQTQYKTKLVFRLNDNIRFVTNTSKRVNSEVGDTVEISGTITYSSGRGIKYNKISRCKISEPEIIDEL